MRSRWGACLLILLFFTVGAVIKYYPALTMEDSEPAKTVFLAKSLYSRDLITRVDTQGEKVVALTFDDGPDPRYTPYVLDILAEERVRATFFVIGKSVESFPGLVEQAVLEGHEIENHTYSHPELDQGEEVSFYEELDRCERIITATAGRTPVYFRPPKRLYNHEVIKTAGVNGYQVILWTVCMENRADQTVEDVVKRVMKKVKPGAIILAHDGSLDRRLTVNALPVLIKELRAQGYQFVTLKELMVYHKD